MPLDEERDSLYLPRVRQLENHSPPMDNFHVTNHEDIIVLKLLRVLQDQLPEAIAVADGKGQVFPRAVRDPAKRQFKGSALQPYLRYLLYLMLKVLFFLYLSSPRRRAAAATEIATCRLSSLCDKRGLVDVAGIESRHALRFAYLFHQSKNGFCR